MHVAKPARVPKEVDIRLLQEVFADVREIRTLRRIEDRRIDIVRKKIVRAIVSSIVRRHRSYRKKRDDVPENLFDWLDGRRLEDTYLNHSYATRLMWASRPLIAIRDSTDLSYKRQVNDHWWIFDDVSAALRKAVPHAPKVIRAYPSIPTVMQYDKIPTMNFFVTT